MALDLANGIEMGTSVGGIGGLGLGWIGCRVLWNFRPPFLQPGAVSFPLDLRVLAFTAAVTLLTGILFGIAPALRASTPDLAAIMKSGGRGAAEAFAKTPLGAALVVGEVGLALVALIGAGLFIRSAQNAQGRIRHSPQSARARLPVVTST